MTRKKKNNLIEKPAFEPAFKAFSEEPAQEVWTLPAERQETVEVAKEELPQVEEIQPIPELTLPPKEEPVTTEEVQAELEKVMTPEPVDEVAQEPVVEVAQEPVVEVAQEPVVEIAQEPVDEVAQEPVVEIAQEPVVEIAQEPVVEIAQEPVVETKLSEEDKKIAAMTQQAEDLKAALQKARASQQLTSSEPKPMIPQKKQVEKAVDERRRRVLLGKHATKTITAESGTLVVEAGAEVTEEVLQRARLSNKFIELSMNVQ